MTDNIEIIRSRRRTVEVEVRRDLSIIVRAPLRMTNNEIQRFLNEKRVWIEKHTELVRQRNERKSPPLTAEEIAGLAAAARIDIPHRVAYYAERIGVTYNRITIRSQHRRWGSCSSKGNLSFNCLLMLCPTEVRDYVVVHELCHIIELNHSPRFWKNVGRIMPEYALRRKWLKDSGSEIIGRVDR